MNENIENIIMLKGLDLISIKIEDLQFGYDLWKLTQEEYYVKITGEWNENIQLEYYKEEIKRKIENNFIIKYDEKDIGWLEYEIFKEYIFIKKIHILTKYQGKGIGTKIINEIIKYCEKNNLDIYLDVFQYNEKGLNYYKKLGFKKYTESNLFNSLMYKIKNNKKRQTST